MRQILTLTILFFASLTALGQIVATTKDGKKVILNSDGTWKYDEEKDNKISFECSDLVEVTTDKVTGKSTKGGKETIAVSKDSKRGFGFYIFEGSSGSVILAVEVLGASPCIDNTDKMNVLFRDGTRLELVNNKKYNCDNDFSLYFGGVHGKKKELEAFRTKCCVVVSTPKNSTV